MLGLYFLRHVYTCVYTVILLYHQLEEKVREWQESAFSDECPWVAAQDDWVELVQPALKFLAGETIGQSFIFSEMKTLYLCCFVISRP